MKLFLVVVSSFIFAFVGQSCCNGGVQDTHIFVINRIECDNLLYVHNDSIHQIDTVRNRESVHLDSTAHYVIHLSLNDSVVSIVEASEFTGFGQKAYACEESFDLGRMRNDIVLLTISTVHDFDSGHLAGSNMEGMFTVNERDLSSNTALSMQEIAAELNLALNNQMYYPTSKFSPTLYLVQPPTLSDTFSFSISLLFEDGRNIIGKTEEVLIK